MKTSAMDNKTILEHLKGAYPKVFEGAAEVRTLTVVPGIDDKILEILYENDKQRSIRWFDRTDLHETLRKLEENI